MADRVIVGGPASQELAASLSKSLRIPLASVSYRDFPDGEVKVTVDEKVEGFSVIIVQSTHPPVDKHLMELFFLAHYLAQEGAKVHAVIPYLAYARQDKAFLQGEVVSLGVVSHLLRAVGVSRVTTVDIHSAEGLSLFSVPIYSASAIPGLVQHVKKNSGLRNTVAVSPDFGGSKRTEAFAALYGAEFLQLTKQRDRITGAVTTEGKRSEVGGRDVVIVDDIISTGGTIRSATELLRKAGARKVVAVCSHPLLVGDAYEKLIGAGVDEIIGTNTVPSRVSKVDVTEVIASHLRTLVE